MDLNLPVSDVMTIDQLLGKSTVEASFDATLVSVFAGLSLLLLAARGCSECSPILRQSAPRRSRSALLLVHRASRCSAK